MKILNLIVNTVAVASLNVLAACTANLSGDGNPVGLGDGRELRVSSEPVSGTVDGKYFKISKALATKGLNSEYSIVLVGDGVELNCNLTFPFAPQITFVVPGTGVFQYDGSGGGRIVNFIFPYRTTNGGGSDNLLAAKSLIQIDRIGNGILEGSVAAISSQDISHAYDISGKFKATICPY